MGMPKPKLKRIPCKRITYKRYKNAPRCKDEGIFIYFIYETEKASKSEFTLDNADRNYRKMWSSSNLARKERRWNDQIIVRDSDGYLRGISTPSPVKPRWKKEGDGPTRREVLEYMTAQTRVATISHIKVKFGCDNKKAAKILKKSLDKGILKFDPITKSYRGHKEQLPHPNTKFKADLYNEQRKLRAMYGHMPEGFRDGKDVTASEVVLWIAGIGGEGLVFHGVTLGSGPVSIEVADKIWDRMRNCSKNTDRLPHVYDEATNSYSGFYTLAAKIAKIAAEEKAAAKTARVEARAKALAENHLNQL
jgi:hypothetical protein